MPYSLSFDFLFHLGDMDVASDVFIPEDYVWSRRKEKMSPKQAAVAGRKEAWTAFRMNSLPLDTTSHSSGRGFNPGGTTFSEEIVLNFLTP